LLVSGLPADRCVLLQHRVLTSHLTEGKQRGNHPDSYKMPANAVGPLIFFLAILLTSAHLLGHLFARLRQPRVIGEILAGILLGPFVLGRVAAYNNLFQLNVAAEPKKAALDLLYQLGLLLLMFLSGAETKALFQKHERKQIAWLASVGTVLPFFIMLALAALLPLGWFMGERSNRTSLLWR
jgi:Kef-type K+ transport system membrane component KefB